MWVWDQEDPHYLRNKEYPTKVLTFDKDAYNANGWGNLILLDRDHTGGQTQHFEVINDEIVCKWNNLRVEILNTVVGCGNGANPPMWDLEGIVMLFTRGGKYCSTSARCSEA